MGVTSVMKCLSCEGRKGVKFNLSSGGSFWMFLLLASGVPASTASFLKSGSEITRAQEFLHPCQQLLECYQRVWSRVHDFPVLQVCLVVQFSDEEENKLALCLLLMKEKNSCICFMLLFDLNQMHSRFLNASSGKFYLLTFSYGPGWWFVVCFFVCFLSNS